MPDEDDDDARAAAAGVCWRWRKAAEALHGDEGREAPEGHHAGRGAARATATSPIVFCRFIPTADYVAEHLRETLGRRSRSRPSPARSRRPSARTRVAQLGQPAKRVLVAPTASARASTSRTSFDAVVHYDLAWNPTRHEQREGRVDRFGQPSPNVRGAHLLRRDNQIDGIVLDVLLRKHKAIRNSLGVSVPPADGQRAGHRGDLRGDAAAGQELPARGRCSTTSATSRSVELFQQWEAATEREKRSRTMFAQETIKVEEVVRELDGGPRRHRLGRGRRPVRPGPRWRPTVRSSRATDPIRVDLTETPRAVRDLLGVPDRFSARFELPVAPGQLRPEPHPPAGRALANHVLNTALDPLLEGVARRCGVIRTGRVTRRTTLLLLRLRFHIVTRLASEERPLLAEDCQLARLRRSPQNAEWLPEEQAEALLEAEPEANVSPDQAVALPAAGGRRVRRTCARTWTSRPGRGASAARRPPPGPRRPAGQGRQPPCRAAAAARRAGHLRLPAQEREPGTTISHGLWTRSLRPVPT